MKREDFLGVVRFVESLWPNSKAFGDGTLSDAFTEFEDLEADHVRTAASRLFRRGLEFGPSLSQLRKEAGDVAREEARIGTTTKRELPRGRTMTYREWCQETYGEVVPFGDLIRRRHREIEGSMVTGETEVRLPGETGLLQDGAPIEIRCRSPLCDVHHPETAPAVFDGAFS